MRKYASIVSVLAISFALYGCVSDLVGGASVNPAPFVHFGTKVQNSGVNVTVNAGDTLFDIATRNRVPLRSLIDLNSIGSSFEINVGQVLQLPAPDVYTVKRGDTVFSIARVFGLDQSEIVRLNRLSPPYTLKIGQALRLPPKTTVGSSRSTRVASTSRVTNSRADVPRSTSRIDASNIPPVPSSKPSTSYETASVSPRSKPRYTSQSKRNTPKFSSSSGPQFAWPVRGRVISAFGPKSSGRHNDGINIGAPSGTVIRAAENGEVVYTGSDLSGFGNLVLLRHDKGWMTAYGHIDDIKVKRGQVVNRGQTIATVGRSGNAESPQLHFEVRKGSTPYDPQRYLR